MKLTKSFAVLLLSLSLSLFSFLVLPVQTAYAQDTRIAVQRGYRTGYSDGYMSGYRDVIENVSKNPAHHNEYAKADRAYNKDYGVLDDYRDGYQQGFEVGYETGYEKRSFDATLPIDLNKRGVKTVSANENPIVEQTLPENNVAETVVPANSTPEISAPVEEATPENPTYTNQTPQIKTRSTEQITYQANDGATIIIPTDAEIIVELVDELGTERSRAGDKFTARVISPSEISGAMIEGRVSKIQRPGRIKRRSELSLSFDRIILNETRWSNFNAILTEVLPVKGDNVRNVDAEGTAVGRSSIKDDSVKVGATTGTGLVIGAIAGGPVGAAVGASVGAAFGVGAVVIERGKNINLNRSQQLRIKTSYETQIR
jgi:hypothetical protein